ncbi:MAG: hypothetical protein WC343_06090 [Bacilli bacterium]|jgi:hypothetical protein
MDEKKRLLAVCEAHCCDQDFCDGDIIVFWVTPEFIERMEELWEHSRRAMQDKESTIHIAYREPELYLLNIPYDGGDDKSKAIVEAFENAAQDGIAFAKINHNPAMQLEDRLSTDLHSVLFRKEPVGWEPNFYLRLYLKNTGIAFETTLIKISTLKEALKTL